MVLLLLLFFFPFFFFAKFASQKTIKYRIRQALWRLKKSSGKTIVQTYIYRNLEYRSFFSKKCIISYFHKGE